MKGLSSLKEEGDDSLSKTGGGGDDSDSSDDDDEEDDDDINDVEAAPVHEEEDKELTKKFGSSDSMVTSSEGTVHWGDYSAKDGVQVTFRPNNSNDVDDTKSNTTITSNDISSNKWQFSISSVVMSAWLQIHQGGGDPIANNIKLNPWACMKSSLDYFSRKPVVCVFILRSGRFAGAIFKGKAVLEHKTLRRYTVRAKAGGGQSSHDKQSGKAQSAGAMLRRYGEEALKEDVKKLLSLWRSHLDSAGLVLFSIPKTMRNIMFEEGSDAPLRKGDSRVVNVPFMVRLPTFEEAQLIHARISAVLFTRTHMTAVDTVAAAAVKNNNSVLAPVLEIRRGITDSAFSVDLGAALEELAVENRTQSIARKEERKLAKQRKASKKAAEQGQGGAALLNISEEEYAESAPPLSKELLGPLSELMTVGKGNESESALTDQVLSTVKKITELADKTEVASILRQTDSLRDMHSPLHLASECGNVDIVEALLMAGSDPGASDGYGRNPYLVARDKATREMFRRCRGVIEARVGMEKEKKGANASSGGADGITTTSFGIWDWEAAGVGAALTDDIEAARKEAQKEKEKERKKRAKQRKQEAARAEVQQAADFALAKELQEKEAIEDEERRKASAGKCAQCSSHLYKVKVFALQDCKCCSAACVMSLRRRLAADAAERRFAK
jgi:hypothetical protein